MGSINTPSSPYRTACHLFDSKIWIWVLGYSSTFCNVTTNACINATKARVFSRLIGISQILISTVPKPGWGLTSHQRSFTDLIMSAFIKLFVSFVKWFQSFK